MKRIKLLVYAALLVPICLANPQTASASTITAVLCAGPEFPCLPGNTLDSGLRTNGLGALFANQYSLLPFTFDDASVNFTGTMMAVDSQAKFIYLWGGGIGTSKLGVGPLWLDVQLSQTYMTAPGVWSFSEFNSGNCNVAAIAAGDNVLATMAINGATPLPVMNGVCQPFNVAGGPVGVALGAATTLTGLAQFRFNAGAVNQQVDLPWGMDFPDPAITVFPDPNNIPPGFANQAVPEPATGLLVGSILAIRFLRRRSRP